MRGQFIVTDVKIHSSELTFEEFIKQEIKKYTDDGLAGMYAMKKNVAFADIVILWCDSKTEFEEKYLADLKKEGFEVIIKTKKAEPFIVVNDTLLDYKQIDIINPKEEVEILLDFNNKRLWINVDGINVLRIINIPKLKKNY